MTDEKVTDLESERAKRREPSETTIYACPDCGCGQFWLYVVAGAVCVNCECVLEDLRIERD